MLNTLARECFSFYSTTYIMNKYDIKVSAYYFVKITTVVLRWLLEPELIECLLEQLKRDFMINIMHLGPIIT